MASYKTFITIEDPNHVVLPDLPFQQGQRVRVFILSESDGRSVLSQKFRKLFRDTQAIPRVSEITEKDISE
jgi:hypothetical protein